jgi:molybdenum cofactor biosynthesis enzyme MoaA
MKFKCLYPFIFLEFHPRGEVYACCPAWTNYGPVGNIYKQTIDEIWNGSKIAELRRRVYAGKYQGICNLDYCPIFKSKEKFSVDKDNQLGKILNQIKAGKVRLDTYPWEVSLAHSGVCNLRCKMCISHQEYNPPEPELEDKIFNQVIPQLLPHLRYIKLGGNGEPFVQKGVDNFLRDFQPEKYPNLEFKVLTNGLLFNQQLWGEIKHNRFFSINVSIDAATAETYKKIRGTKSWDVLVKNLNLISSLRQRNCFKKFFINFTVMKSNHKELLEFARLGLSLGCDRVYFNKIFDLQNLEENINMFPKSYIYSSIKKQLKEPIFNDDRIDISSIREYQGKKLNWVNDLASNLKLIIFFPLAKLKKSVLIKRIYREVERLVKFQNF